MFFFWLWEKEIYKFNYIFEGSYEILDVDILIIRTNFQKSNLGWPQQPPTENVQKLKNDISWFH